MQNINHFKIKESITILDDIQIFLLSISENIDGINIENIPATQLQEIKQYKYETDRNKRLLARLFLFSYVFHHFNVRDFTFAYNQYKQPYFLVTPEVQFSFSYSGDYILVGVTKHRKIGVDIEYMDDQIEMNEIAPYIMHPLELEKFILFQDNKIKRKFFFELFSAKESIIKAYGTGLYFDVTKLNLLAGNRTQHKHADYVQEKTAWQLDKYASSICYQESNFTIGN